MKRDGSKDTSKTAAELMAEVEADPQCLAQRKAKEEERAKAVAQHLQNSRPLLLDLAAAGFQVDTVAGLYNGKTDYEQAIPILLSWLPRMADPAVKESIVRALTVKWAKPVAAEPLIQEFRRVDVSTSGSLRWAIANALSEVADDSVFDDIVQLANDRRYGRDREMLALALGNMKNPQAVSVLVDLLDDEEVVGHAVIGLRMLRAKGVRSHLEKLVNHPKSWIRKEVAKALKKAV